MRRGVAFCLLVLFTAPGNVIVLTSCGIGQMFPVIAMRRFTSAYGYHCAFYGGDRDRRNRPCFLESEASREITLRFATSAFASDLAATQRMMADSG